MTRAGLLKGKTIGIDATTLEANAAMKTIVRRDTEESYTEYLKHLAQEEGEQCGVGEPARCGGRDHAHEGWGSAVQSV